MRHRRNGPPRRFDYPNFWNLIARKANVFDRLEWRGWYHAYSPVNSFCGAGPAYLVNGVGHVKIDGKPAGVLDEYGPIRGEPAQWDFTGLSPGTHTLKLIVLAESNPKPKGRFLNLAWIGALARGP